MTDRFIVTPKKKNLNFNQNRQQQEEFEQQKSPANYLRQILEREGGKVVEEKKINDYKGNKDKNLFLEKMDIYLKETKKGIFINKRPDRILEALSLAKNPDANPLSCSREGTLAVGLSRGIYICSGNSSISRIRIQPGIWTLSWSDVYANGLACGSENGTIEIWDAERGIVVRHWLPRKRGVINSLSWSENSLYSGCNAGGLYHYDIRSNHEYKLNSKKQNFPILKIETQKIHKNLLAVNFENSTLKIWNLRAQKYEYKLMSDHIIRGLHWNPINENFLAYGDNTQKQIKIFNIVSGTTVKSFIAGQQISNFLFTLSSDQVISSHGGQKKQIYVWNCQTMKKQKIIPGQNHKTIHLAYNDYQGQVISGASDETLRFWKIKEEIKEEKEDEKYFMQIR